MSAAAVRWLACALGPRWCPGEARGGWAGGSGGIAQTIDELFDGVVVALDGGALLVGERDLDEHPLQPVVGFEQLASLDGFGM